MHIVLTHNSRLPVKGYGGSERVVVWLARGLAELGHRVSLIAAEGSKVPETTLIPVKPGLFGKPEFDIAHYLPPDGDILHAHFPLRLSPALPHVWTLHGNSKDGVTRPPNTIYVSADHAARHGSTAFVYNGVDLAELTFRAEKGDYDLFLGRLHSDKGYHWAIEAAKRTRRRLVVAGGWRPVLSRWIKFVGEVDGAEKAEWLAGARLLWMPALWDEPCGLVLLEALASGTPILGTRRGSLPEIVSPDTGALGDTLDELIEQIPLAERKRPDLCRARAERYFSHRVMAEEYVRFYTHFLANGALPEGRKTEN